jgi:NADPH:quinone reductase
MATVNRQITLAARPQGFPKISDFQLIYAPMPTPAAGEVLVRSVYLSLDPYMRGRMSEAPSYAEPVGLGEVMVGGAVGVVLESKSPAFRSGDAVEGMIGWQEFAAMPGLELRRFDTSRAPLSTALGVLGMPGLTALFGLLEIGQPQPGETVVVSGAAGAVGSLVGQIAKNIGCRAVGVAGSDAKIAWLLDELGFDGAFNYKTTTDYDQKLAELCPDGIDIYFDNVGGALSDAVFARLNPGARVVVCGQISQYNLLAPELGPRWLGHLIVKQAKVEGFLVSRFAERFEQGLEQLARWLEQGKLKYREDVAEGLEAAPQAFLGMLQGSNEGKQLVQVSRP